MIGGTPHRKEEASSEILIEAGKSIVSTPSEAARLALNSFSSPSFTMALPSGVESCLK